MKPGKTAPTWFSPEKNHQVQARSPFSWFNYGKLRLVYRTPRWPVWVCLNHFFPGWAVGPPQKNIKKYEGQLGYETCTFFSLVARCRIHCAILTSKSAPRLSAVNAFKFEMCFAPQRRALFETQLPKVLRTWCVLHQVRFRNLFPPQRRALFQHLNFQKCSEPGVSCTFWLGHVLRATTRLNIWASKSAPRLRCFAHFDFEICFVRQRSVLFQHLNFQKWSENGVLCAFWLRNVLRATTRLNIWASKSAPRLRCFAHFDFEICFVRQRSVLFQHLNFQKWSENGVLCTFWLRNVLRATTRLNIWASKSAPRLRCFAHFDFEICFVRQRSVLFQHLNFQKWSENGVLCTFWLRNVLRATTACNCSSLIWPAGSAPVALASLLLDPPEPQIIRKTQCSATFLPFRAPESSFFRLFLFSDSSHLCFSTVHIVGSLTSKRSSIKAPTSLTHLSHNWNPWWPWPTFSECLQQRSENFRLRLGRPQGHWCFAPKKTSIFSETSGSALSKLWNSTVEKGPTSSSSGRPSFEPHLHVLWGKRW